MDDNLMTDLLQQHGCCHINLMKSSLSSEEMILGWIYDNLSCIYLADGFINI